MNISSFFKKVIEFGIERDVRGKGKRLDYFPDTAVLHGAPKAEVRKILIGIDIEVQELLLADRLRSSCGLDLVIAHHPEGHAYAALAEVMNLQVDMLIAAGFPKSAAMAFLDERMRQVQRKVLPQNHMRSVDAARLLDMPFMCVHTPADNHVYCFIRQLLKQRKPGRVSDVVDILRAIPEYKEASGYNAGPRVILGNPRRQAGKIFIEMTGGTEGPRDIYDKLFKRGIRTLVCMHLSEEHFKKVKDASLNVVIAGHISSDTLGLNLLLDRIEKYARERFEVISCSGFRRVRRN